MGHEEMRKQKKARERNIPKLSLAQEDENPGGFGNPGSRIQNSTSARILRP
jgi:hypothetical protein